MTRFLITTDNGYGTSGCFIKAETKEQALEIFKTAPEYRCIKGEVVSVESEFEAGCWLED